MIREKTYDNLYINANFLNGYYNKGEEKGEFLTITNNERFEIKSIKLSIKGEVKSFIHLETYEINNLKPKDERTILVNIRIPPTLNKDQYIGKLIININNEKIKELPISLSITDY